MAALPLADIIASLVSACIQGEAEGAFAALGFIRSIGFVGEAAERDDWGAIRFVRFSFSDMRQGDRIPAKRTIRVPLLSLVPIPLQQIQNADYEFFVRVVERDSVESESHSPMQTPSSRKPAPLLAEIAPFTDDSSTRPPSIRV